MTPTDVMKMDKCIQQLEERIKHLEEALDSAEDDLSVKDAQLTVALECMGKAHGLYEEIERLQPYKDQLELPLGDNPT